MYKPLGPGQFRVLDIEPGHLGDSLQCRLRIVSFRAKQSVSYEAISYVWGDTGVKYPIRCNRKTFHATHNLFSALQNLRRAADIRTVWVDAICLNQSDTDELNRQVGMMFDIYRRATMVVVWLGESDERSRRAIGAVEDLAKRRKTDIPDPRTNILEEHHYNSIPNLVFSDAALILNLIKRPWFTRGWIIQELAVSRATSIICGRDVTTWDRLVQAVYWIQSCGLTHFAQEEADLVMRIQRSHCEFREDNRRPLVSLLLRHRVAATTLRQDKIYALSGLSSDWRDFGVDVDYGQPWDQVYKDVAIAVLKNSDNLDILSGPRPGPEDDGFHLLPSWVPDWSSHDRTSSILGPEVTRSEDRVLHATGDTRPSLSFSDDLSQLRLVGHLIDRVELISLAMSRVADPEALFRNWRASERTFQSMEHVSAARVPGSNYVNGEAMLDVYWQTLLAGYEFGEYAYRRGLFMTWDRLNVFHRWNRRFIDWAAVYSVSLLVCSFFVEVGAFILSGSILLNFPLSHAGSILTDAALELARRRFAGKAMDLGVCLAATLTYTQNPYVRLAHFVYLMYLGNIAFPMVPPTILPLVYFLKTMLGIWLKLQWADPRTFYKMVSPGRAMARTRGGLLAMVPEATQPGDQVAIFKGGKTPLVIRQDGAQWVIVGDAYVHGIMKGEYLREQECKDFWFK